MLRHVLVLMAVTTVALAALARYPLEDKPEEYEDCDGCWVSAIQEFIPTGESFPSPTKCEEYQCTSTYLVVASCGVVAVTPPCYKTRNSSLTYPACCEQAVCP